jgi:hypothetical protein
MSRFIVPFLDFFRKATDAPMEFGEGAALMALSTIAIGRRWVDVGEGVQANLYMMIVGDSSVARKSTSVNYAKRMIHFVEPRRAAPNDYTMEGLMKWMGETPDGEPKGSKLKQNCLCLFSDEFGSDLSRMTAYGPTMQADFCRLYDGQNITKIRVASPPLVVENPRVSMLAGAAYQMLQAHLMAKDWTNGFLMRFLYVAPGQMRPKFTLQPKRPQLEWDIAQNGLSAILTELNTPVQHGPPALPGLPPQMRTWFGLGIDPAAQIQYESMNQWFDSITPTLSFIGQIYVERFKASVQKVALLYQIDEDSTLPIGLNAMQRALNFCGNVCWPSFKVAYEKTTSSEFGALAELVEQILRDNNGSVPVRVLASRFKNNRQLLKVMEYMVGSDHARRRKIVTNNISVEVLELTT